MEARKLENLYVDALRARKRLLTARRWKKSSGSFYKELERVILSLVADRVSSLSSRIREYLDVKSKASSESKVSKSKNVVSGGEFAVYRAACCYPLPPEKIIGVVRTGKGIIAHRAKCPALDRLKDNIHPDRFVDLDWGDLEHLRDNYGGYPTRLLMRVVDRVGLLHDVTRVLLNEEKSIQYIKTWRTKGRKGEVLLEIEVSLKDMNEFRRIRRALMSVNGVLSVRRGRKL
jgi:(p)ppGpp synthase/HD superfamily hydrolase